MKKFKLFVLLICMFVPMLISGCENINKNSLSTPSIVDIRGGTVVFNTVKNAGYYTLSINDNEVNIDPKYSPYVEIIDNKIIYNASKIFIKGESYAVKVKANSEKHASSNYSSSYTYKHSGSIEKPSNVKINTTTLTWNAVENASFYIVKIITPNDKIIFDKQGNVLDVINSENVSMADITEYTFNTNSFNFSSILTEAGKYEFYISAVLQDTSTYTESLFSNKISYTYNLTLNTPTNGKVYKIDSDLHLMTILDSNANAISITCNGLEKTTEVNSSDSSIQKLSSNAFDINLSKYFESYISSGMLSLDDYTNHIFTLQAKYIAPNINNYYYLDSAISSDISFENTYKLETPELSIEQNASGNFVVSWNSDESSLISGYKLIVCTAEEPIEYSFNSDITSIIIDKNILGVAVQAIGKGNYLTSDISEFISPNTLTLTLNVMHGYSNIDNGSGIKFQWTNNYGYYLVVTEDSYIKTLNNYYTINASNFTSNKLNVKVVSIKDNYKAHTFTENLELTRKLNAPTISSDQGFNSGNIYELTFTGVTNAIGYYVYVKGDNSDEFIKLDTLYSTTTIDLSKYIISEGEYTNYEVKIQAVADIHSNYKDSDLSKAITVSHVKVLKKPEYASINNIPTPVLKQISGSSIKYLLQFKPVMEDNEEIANSYEILINYNRISIKATPGTELYQIDITKYLTAANNYEIKVRAIPADTETNVVASEYNITYYLLSKQLAMVDNIQINENEGIYTLSFRLIDNADGYRIRIVKENDSQYVSYLNELGLSNTLTVKQSTDVTKYVQQQGVYYFYVTALAPKQNSYYADANESMSYATLSKLTSLRSPSDLRYENVSSTVYNIQWSGDINADYFRIIITDPNNIDYELSVTDENKFQNVYEEDSNGEPVLIAYKYIKNINEYITVPGNYKVTIYSMVEALGETAKEYASSAATEYIWDYAYEKEIDFERYSISFHGTNANFVINNVNDLKNQLWYHYLYGMGGTDLSLITKIGLCSTNANFCDCNVFAKVLSQGGSTNNLSNHSDAKIAKSTLDSFDSLSESFAQFMEFFSTSAETNYLVSSGSDEYSAYESFFNRSKAVFKYSNDNTIKNLEYNISDSIVVGINKPFTISFNESSLNRNDLITAISKLFAYNDSSIFSEYAQNITNTLTSNAAEASNSSAMAKMKYDGAIYTENNSFVLPFTFKQNNTTVITFIIVNNGVMSMWINKLTDAIDISNSSRAINVYGRCSLFETSLRTFIVDLSVEATNLGLYNFAGLNEQGKLLNTSETILNNYSEIDQTDGDTIWYNFVSGTGQLADLDLFKYLCEKLLQSYPELNNLVSQNVSIEAVNKTTHIIFKLGFENELEFKNGSYVKKKDNNLNTKDINDYGNKFSYIDTYARKSPTGAFAIDVREEMLVTTTEQLVHAVQNNYKPKFVGNSSIAETVYANAKLVLSAIVTNNMSDLDKVTAIFDWLEANFTLTYYNIEGSTYVSGTVEKANMSHYGQYKQYYLEGIFEDIYATEDGDIIVPSHLATSWSYSKAFALLTAIEGIESRVVYGTYKYKDSHLSGSPIATAEHVWNKVYLKTSASATKAWYAVDITLSDNKITFTSISNGYGISSHSYFLCSDTHITDNHPMNITISESTHLIPNQYKRCEDNYNYYLNSAFSATKNELLENLNGVDRYSDLTGFKYLKQFENSQNSENKKYQGYPPTSEFGDLQNFLLNTVIYSWITTQNNNPTINQTNSIRRGMFEFSYPAKMFSADNISRLINMFNSNIAGIYGIKLNLVTDAYIDLQIYMITNSNLGITTVIYTVEYISNF